MNWLGCLICAVTIGGQDDVDPGLQRINERASDARAYWYDHATLPRVYEHRGRLFAQGVDIGPPGGRNQRELAGSPINMHPWANAAGIDRCGNEVTVKRLFWMPENTRIQIWNEAERGTSVFPPPTRVAGSFPVGTMFVEYLYESERVFEIRSREKTGYQKWDTQRFEFGDKPPGFDEDLINGCQECHSDVGRSAPGLDVLNRQQIVEWYGNVSGLEKGGPLHFHPWQFGTPRGGGLASGQPIQIRGDMKGLVEWVEQRTQ